MTGDSLEPVPHALDGGVQLWRVNLDAYPPVDAQDGVSADEVARVERQRCDRDARRLLAARHALRRVLSIATGQPAGALVIEADAYGKPRLRDQGTLEFNLSHSAHECLIGISAGRPIGVDVEVLGPVVDADALARHHFTQVEFAEWVRAPAALRDRAFLTCWTRKEACVKALGVGLSAQPALVEAGGRGDTRAALVSIGAGQCEIALCSLDISSEAVAAVAVCAARDAEAARRYFARS
jgi:4'-phosphopantetheinyl transferase